MPNDVVSGQRRITRSASATASQPLSKEVVPTAAEKRTPPTPEVKSKSEIKKKMKRTTTPSPLRRSERTRNCSSSSTPSPVPSPSTSTNSKKHETGRKLPFEDEGKDGGTSPKLKIKTLNARTYRASFKINVRDFPTKSNSMDRSVDKSTPEDNSKGGGKIDECSKGNSLHHKAVSKDCTLPSEHVKDNNMSAESRLTGPVNKLVGNNVPLGSRVPTIATTHETSGAPERVQSDCHGEEMPHTLASKNSDLNESSIRRCNGRDEAENLTPSKRKSPVMDMCSDISATLVNDNKCNLAVDAGQSRLCCNVVETSGPFSKRIRGVSFSDVERDPRKLTNNVDEPSAKYNDKKSSARKKEGKSGDSVERPQGNNVETEKIRKQQRSLHLSLKPGIVKLCEILLLPDDIKSMVENCLEYTMNNYQISTEPASIVQAFQLSLCWTAASLLRHKLDLEASLVLAKQHLNFDCKKDVVDEINARLWDLKDNFLSLTGNSRVIGSPKGSESLYRVHSNSEVTPEVELTEKDIPKNIEGTEKRKSEWRKLIQMQQEHKHKLEEDIETEKADFVRRSKIELAAIRSCSSGDGLRNEKLKVFNSEYDKRKGELRSRQEVLLKDLETKQLEARRKLQESWAPHELLNLDSSKVLGTLDNASVILLPYNVAGGKNFDNMIQTMTWNGTWAGFSETPISNPSAVVLRSSPVELQTSIGKHADVNEMDILASKDRPVSGDNGHDIVENENDDQQSITSKHSNSRDQCSEGAASMEDVGEGCENFSREFHDDCGQPTVTMILPSSNREICGGGASDVPDGEVAPAVHQTGSSHDDSRQGKLDGTILSEPVCSLSTKIKANGFIDSVKNMVSLNSQEPEEHILSKDTAHIHEAGDRNGSANADTLNSPLSDENSKSPQELVRGVTVVCLPNGQISGNGSNNVVTLNSPLNEKSADGNLIDREVHEEMPEIVNITPLSMEQISLGALSVSVSNKLLSSTCATASLDASAINLLNQPSPEKQNPHGVSSNIPAGQDPTEVSETSHDWASASELDREAVVGSPSSIKSTDYPANTAPPNSSPTDQLSDGGLVEEVLSSLPCSSSTPSNGRPATISLLNPASLKQQIPNEVLAITTDGHIPVMVSENSHEQAECQLTDNVVVNISTTPDHHQEGVHRTMTESTSSQETPVSRPVGIVEPQEQVQPLSPVESLYSPVDKLPANQSNHVSMVMEPPEQVQQLPSSGLLSSNCDLSNPHLMTGEDRAATNEDALPSQIPEGSTEVQNQVSEQPPSNSEVGPRQAVVSLVSNMVHDSLVPGGVRTQYSDIRNLSPHGVFSNHPIQTVTRSAYMTPPPLCHDPLRNELERLRRLTEQHKKNYDDVRLQLNCDFEKEFEEIRRKYDIKLKEMEAEFQKARENQDTQLNMIHRHRALRDVFFAAKCDPIFSFPSGMQRDAGFPQLSQPSRQQNTTHSSQVATPSPCRPPPAVNLQSPYARTGSQAMLSPHMQPTYNTSGISSGVSIGLPHINVQAAGARLPRINSISLPLGNLHTGGELRAPAPHLQPYRPPTSAPSSSLNAAPHGMPSHPARGNGSAMSSLYSQWQLQRMPTTSQSDPHWGNWHENTSGLPTANVSAVDLRVDANSQYGINLLNAVPRMSDLASINPSKSGISSTSANLAQEATPSDVVCLSDDE